VTADRLNLYSGPRTVCAAVDAGTMPPIKTSSACIRTITGYRMFTCRNLQLLPMRKTQLLDTSIVSKLQQAIPREEQGLSHSRVIRLPFLPLAMQPLNSGARSFWCSSIHRAPAAGLQAARPQDAPQRLPPRPRAARSRTTPPPDKPPPSVHAHTGPGTPIC